VKLCQFDDLLEELANSDDAEFSDRKSIVHLERLRSRLDALCAKKLHAFELSESWVTSGAKSVKRWVSKETRGSAKEVGRQVNRSRDLPEMPLFAVAWADGSITSDHIDVARRLRRPATEEFFERDEAMLVNEARRLTFRQFERFCKYWDQHADPDGVEESALEREARRDVSLSQSWDGMYFGKMTMDPLGGTAFYDELARLERELYLEDWTKANEELGRDPLGCELTRTSNQRRHDALVRMAIRSATAPADGKPPAPLISVLVDYETFRGRICELANGTVVTPGSLLPWLESSDIERAVFTPGGRVEVGIKSRLFSGATRRAIEIRDRECQHDYCEEVPSRCQVDHKVEYSKGGLTTQENGRLLCGFHNRLRNRHIECDDAVTEPDEYIDDFGDWFNQRPPPNG